MRFRHPDGTTVHLAYCTNVHPADTLSGVLSALDRYSAPVRAAVGVDRLGVGLWLARDAVSELLAAPDGVRRLAAELSARGLEVVTLNAFPYGGFGDAVVKGAVYHPDWTTPDRLRYTLDCAGLLADLLPGDAGYGSVSTLPLAWREPWDAHRSRAAAGNVAHLARGLAELADRTGREVRVGFEPEPGCIVETTAEAAAHLAPVAGERIGVCLDACHLAVAFEEPAAAVERLTAGGLPVVKTQVSCALQSDDGGDAAARAALHGFVEPRYLHQVRTRTAAGIVGTDDLDQALADGLPGGAPWRVHFHVPLHAAPAEPLRSTSDQLVRTLRVLLGGPRALTGHLEVETYTWQVLPAAARPAGDDELVAGIAAELDWTRGMLREIGLEEVA
jgi:sugar phosphate isomerase/epimerase